jgi:hypothetical protein
LGKICKHLPSAVVAARHLGYNPQRLKKAPLECPLMLENCASADKWKQNKAFFLRSAVLASNDPDYPGKRLNTAATFIICRSSNIEYK